MTAVPTVSVLLVTYMHEQYIDQAIQSVLAQRLTGGLELIVSEDCSPDRTGDIVMEYATRHPEQVTVLRSVRNRNDQEVFLRAYRAARGRYIAYLDGDDYWSSPVKLQTQVDFLDANPHASGCAHAVDIVNQRGDVRSEVREVARWLSTEDFLRNNPLRAATILLRRDALGALPQWFEHAPYTDWPLYIVATRSGPIGYLDHVLAAYRKHDGGMWSAAGPAARARTQLDFYDVVLPELSARLRRYARPYVAGYWLDLADALSRTGDRTGALHAWANALRWAPLRPRSGWRPRGRAPRLRPLARAVLGGHGRRRPHTDS